MNKIQLFLKENSTGKNVLVLFLVTQFIYAFMLTVTIPGVMEYSNGLDLLDMQPTGYSSEYAKSLFDTLGEKGRETYLFKQIPVDMIYPALFALAYSLLLFYLFKKSFKLDSKIFTLSLVPILAGLFDYLENIGIIIMITIYPKFYDIIANVTNIFSIFKSLFTTLFFVLLITGVIIIVVKKVRVVFNK